MAARNAMEAAAATLEMQLQADDTDEVLEHLTVADPIIEDEDDIMDGTEADLMGNVSVPSNLLHCSESTYDAAQTEFKKGRPLHAQIPPGTVFNKRYKLERIIGKGSFGCAYLCTDLLEGKEVVIKARVGNVEGMFSESIYDELQVYLQLGATEKQVGIPYIAASGLHKLIPNTPGGKPVYVSYMAMQRLGDSIWACCHRMQHRTVYNKLTGREETKAVPYQPSRDSVVFAGLGMLKSLAAMHARGIIHRDVKTENFCLGGGHDNENIYALDYGFARPAFGWYPYHKYTQTCASYWGTPNYSSLRALERFPQTSRDDLEAMVYCIMEMEMPKCLLPWNSKLTTNSEAAAGWTDEQLDRMAHQKLKFIDEACEQGLVPDYLITLFEYVYNLSYSDVPDYEYIFRLLQSGATGKGPSKPPKACKYSAWPANGCATDQEHRSVTESLLQQLKKAASPILHLLMSDELPVEAPTEQEPAAITCAVVSPQQQQPAARQAGDHQAMVTSESEVQCYSDISDSESDSQQLSADEAELAEICVREADYESDSEVGGDSPGTSQGDSPLRRARAASADLDVSPSSCILQDAKRQRVDSGAVAACFGQVMQAVLEGSQNAYEE